MNVYSGGYALRSAVLRHGLFFMFFSGFTVLNGLSQIIHLPQQYGLGNVKCIAYSPQGNTFLSAGSSGKAYLWDISSRKVIRSFSGHFGAITALAFSSDGSRIVTGSLDYQAMLWNTNTGTRIHVFASHTDQILAVAFYPNGRRILTGSADHTAKIWDAASGALLYTLTGHTLPVTSVAVSPDGSRLITGSNDGTVRHWNAGNGNWISTLTVKSSPPTDFRMIRVDFTPDEATFMTATSGGGVQLWSMANSSLIRTFSGPYNVETYRDVVLSPNGQWLIFSGSYNEDGNSALVEVSTGKLIEEIHGGRTHQAAAFSSRSSKALIAGQFDELMLFDLSTTQGQTSSYIAYSGHSNSVHALALSPDGSRLITGNGCDGSIWDGKVRMYDLSTGNFLRYFDVQSSWQSVNYLGVTFSPDGQQVEGVTQPAYSLHIQWDAVTGVKISSNPNGANYLTYSLDGLWRSTHGRVSNLNGTKGRIFDWDDTYAAAFSADSTKVILGATGHFHIWNMVSDILLTVTTGGANKNLGVAFSPDALSVLTGSEDKTAKLWDARTGALIRTFTGHQDAVTCVAYSPNGKIILTGSKDREVDIWNAHTGELLGGITHMDEVSAVLFSRAGNTFLTGSLDGTVNAWQIVQYDQTQSPWQSYE